MIEQELDDALMAERSGVLVDNDLGRQQLRWLIAEVGEDGVRAAVSQLAGRRRPYTTNIAHVLGLAMPKSLSKTEPKPELPTKRSDTEMYAELLAAAERQRVSNKDAGDRNQTALAAEKVAREAETAKKLASLRAKWNLPSRTHPQPPKV